MIRRGSPTLQPGWAYVGRTICMADGLCFVGGRSKTAAVRSAISASRSCPAGIASISWGAHTAARTMLKTAYGSIQTARPRSIAKD
jgi:hypothetical protein